MTQPFQKLPLKKKPRGLNLDIDGWLRRIGPRAVCRDVSAKRHRHRAAGPADQRRSQGHRRCVVRPSQELLEAIAELAGAFPVSPQPAIEPKARDAAERRQVTVVFSDLVGSTALSARMDPEEPARSHFGLSEVCRRDRGSLRRFVAKYMGDGVLVYLAIRRPMRTTRARCARGA